MPRRPSAFRQHDLTRALRAARAAGLQISGYEIEPSTGKIIVTTNDEALEGNGPSDLQKWLVKNANKIFNQ